LLILPGGSPRNVPDAISLTDVDSSSGMQDTEPAYNREIPPLVSMPSDSA